MIRRVRDEGEHPRAVAAGFGVSPRTAYKWLARFRAGGLAALDDRSSAPRRSPHRLAPERIADIAALRRRRMSSTRIAHRLGVPTSTVVKTLRRLGLNRLKSLEPQQPVVRYERQRPGELDTGGARAHDDEGEPLPHALRIGLQLRMLKGTQDTSPQPRRILDRLQSGKAANPVRCLTGILAGWPPLAYEFLTGADSGSEVESCLW